MKLSESQKKVIRLMQEGWELGRTVTTYAGEREWRLQKNGLGRGGETKDLRSTTGWKLWHLGLIYKPKKELEFPVEHWALTEKGKNEVIK